MRRVTITIDDQGMARFETDLDMPNTLLLLQKMLQQGIAATPVHVGPSGVAVATLAEVPPVPQNRTAGKG